MCLVSVVNFLLIMNLQGQYKSTLTCPTCSKTSVTFDPFMYLSLPVPSTARRAMAVTVFSTDGSREPFSYDVSVPQFGTLSDLVQALSAACTLGDDEALLITEVSFASHLEHF
jgi:ubiquitin carboxyl-terminal hydrolase 4/11/15